MASYLDRRVSSKIRVGVGYGYGCGHGVASVKIGRIFAVWGIDEGGLRHVEEKVSRPGLKTNFGPPPARPRKG